MHFKKTNRPGETVSDNNRKNALKLQRKGKKKTVRAGNAPMVTRFSSLSNADHGGFWG